MILIKMKPKILTEMNLKIYLHLKYDLFNQILSKILMLYEYFKTKQQYLIVFKFTLIKKL